MTKKQIVVLATAASVGAWCVCRNKKYPVRKELRFANKLTVPGWTLNLNTARLANRALDRMALTPSALPSGVERYGTQFFAEDGAPIRLTIYRPEGLDWGAPCLIYFHGGGFCVRDADYIHHYAAQYAQGAGCAVVFVHYRTSDIAPFPTPFEDCYAALRWVWDNAPRLRLDRARIAVGGDSAGGALAAACALRARDEGGPDGNGLHEKVHRQPHVERGAEPKDVEAIPAGWGSRDAAVRRSHTGPGSLRPPARLCGGGAVRLSP